MSPSLLYMARLFISVMPETRLFWLKARILNLAGANLGENTSFCSSAVIMGAGKLNVGEHTWIGHQVLIIAGSSVSIGRFVDIGPRVYIGTGTHKIDSQGVRVAGAGINKDVVIEDGVWLGAGCIILPGVRVGEKSVVAAGAVVTEDIPPLVLAAGVPARPVKQL